MSCSAPFMDCDSAVHVLNPREQLCFLVVHFAICKGVPVTSCGFVKHSQDDNYGASPDGIAEAFAVEVKTRAEGGKTPLTTISGAQYVVQTNLQMARTGGRITFLQSYLPEKDTSNFFYIMRNDLLLNIVKEISDHIMHNTVFAEWHYDDHPQLSKLGEQLIGYTANFDRLRHLRK